MKRIFLTLAILSTVFLTITLVLGLQIEDSRSRDPQKQEQVGVHLLAGMGALCFGVMVHAIAFTYFIGTGRWMEETRNAYGLPDTWRLASHKLKTKTIMQIICIFVLLLATGALGAAADPASPVDYAGLLGMSPATTHFFVATSTLILNVLVFCNEFVSIGRNGTLIEEVMVEVRRIREERGLPV